MRSRLRGFRRQNWFIDTGVMLTSSCSRAVEADVRIGDTGRGKQSLVKYTAVMQKWMPPAITVIVRHVHNAMERFTSACACSSEWHAKTRLTNSSNPFNAGRDPWGLGHGSIGKPRKRMVRSSIVNDMTDLPSYINNHSHRTTPSTYQPIHANGAERSAGVLMNGDRALQAVT